MFDTNNSIEELLNFVTTIKNQKDKLFNEVGTFDKMLGDLDHELELKSMNGAKMLKWAKERKDVLIKRRKKKDELYILTELEKKFPQMNTLYGQIKGIINTTKALEDNLANRFYRPRVLTDRFDLPEMKKEKEEEQLINDVQEKIQTNMKLHKVDSANVIRYQTKESARLDALFDQIKQETSNEEESGIIL